MLAVDLTGPELELALRFLALWLLVTGSYLGLLLAGGPRASRLVIAPGCLLAVLLAASPQRQHRWRRLALVALPLTVAAGGIDGEQCFMHEPYSLSEHVIGTGAPPADMGSPSDPCHWAGAALIATVIIGYEVLSSL